MAGYTPPTFVDGQAPALNAANMNDLAGAVSDADASLMALQQTVSDISEGVQNLQTQMSTVSGAISALNGSVYVLKNTTVNTTAWVASTTFSGFSFQANVSFSGVTNQYVVFVSFSPSDAMSGNYAPVSVSGAGYVTIYAKTKPAATLTIPSMVALKQAGA